MLLFPLINVKMRTIVVNLTFISNKQETFNAQLS